MSKSFFTSVRCFMDMLGITEDHRRGGGRTLRFGYQVEHDGQEARQP
jgi:hypothetical protein